MDQLTNGTKGQSADFIQSLMKTILEQQLTHQRNGNYVQAQKSKIQYEQNRRNLEKRRFYQMQQRHKKQQEDIDKAYQDQLNHFNKFMNQKLQQYQAQGDRNVKQLNQKHNNQYKSTKNQLEQITPIKLKQSSELLNLRKMEQHMAKQKNYVEAHKVQAKAQKMEKEQTAAWLEARRIKIQTALNTLKNKQAGQMAALKKRIQAGLDQQNRQRQFQQLRLRQKYDNVCKQLKSQQDKDILFFKGEFRSKAGQSNQSSPSGTKSKN